MSTYYRMDRSRSPDRRRSREMSNYGFNGTGWRESPPRQLTHTVSLPKLKPYPPERYAPACETCRAPDSKLPD